MTPDEFEKIQNMVVQNMIKEKPKNPWIARFAIAFALSSLFAAVQTHRLHKTRIEKAWAIESWVACVQRQP